jgi:hypothetical protein
LFGIQGLIGSIFEAIFRRVVVDSIDGNFLLYRPGVDIVICLISVGFGILFGIILGIIVRCSNKHYR